MARVDYCIIGYDKFGEQLASKLKQLGKKIMILEIDPNKTDKIRQEYEIVIRCDGRVLNALRDSAVKNVKHVIVAVGTDVESSIMICANLRQLDCKNIIAVAKNSTHAFVLKSIGIINVIVPADIVAEKLAIQLVYNYGADVSVINNEISMVKVVVTNSDFFQQFLSAINFENKYKVKLLCLQRKEKIFFPIPKNIDFKIGDIISIVTPNYNIEKVIKVLTTNEK
jgi:trk system potassium uptake protein TrkA